MISAAALVFASSFCSAASLSLVFLALLLSIALSKIVRACTRHGLPSWVGVALSALSVLSIIAVFVSLLLPAIANQGTALLSHLPAVQKELIARLPSEGPIRDAANKLLESASFSDPQPLLQKFMSWGAAVLTSLSELLLVLVIAIYFLIDGERIYHWLLAFLPPRHRTKVRTAVPEIVEVVSRFVGGQFITSTLCGTYAFAVLYFLHIPNAALLAVFAAIVDVLPVIGFFLFIIPAVALSFTVSPLAAALSAIFYGAYHLLEAYLSSSPRCMATSSSSLLSPSSSLPWLAGCSPASLERSPFSPSSPPTRSSKSSGYSLTWNPTPCLNTWPSEEAAHPESA